MSLFQYPNQRYTSQLGLALFGQDETLAENFLLIDAAYGAGSSINVNGTLVESPNLSSTLPIAPVGDTLVTFQFDSNGNISAYVPTPAPGGVTSLTGDSIVYNNASSVGAVTLSLISQVANTVFAGPTSGPNATPTFRAIVSADIPSTIVLANGITATTQTAGDNTTKIATDAFVQTAIGGSGAVLWSNLGNAAAALTLANANYATTFNQTSAVAWLWANTTVATVSTTNASPLLELAANYWATGGVTGVDLWTIGTAAIAAGLNGISNLTFTHTGSTGQAAVQVPLLDIGGTDAGISRLNAASLAIGNGTAGDFTGSLTLKSILITDTAANADLTLQNTTAAISTTNVASPILTFSGNNWLAGGGPSTVDSWTIQKSAYINGADVSSLVIAHSTPTTGIAGTAVCIKTSLFISAGGLAITGASDALGTSLAIIDTTPQFHMVNSSSNSHPKGQVILMGSSQTVMWGFGVAQYTNTDQFEFWGGPGTSVSGSIMSFAKTTGNCAIGFNSANASYTSGSTLTVFNQKASTGATQLLVQGGAAAADATINALLQVNQGGGTTMVYAVLGNGTVQIGGADTGISRLGAASLAIGNGTAGDKTGILTLKEVILSDFGSAPTSAGTAGTVGEIVQHSGILYFCSVTGPGGGATQWNTITLVPIL